MAQALEDRDLGKMQRVPFDGPILAVPTERRVRAFLGGEAIADSTGALILLEKNHTPVYYLPMADVRMDLLEPTSKSTHCPYKGQASYWTIRVGRRTSENAAWAYLDPVDGAEAVKGHIAFYWNRVESWFEEDSEVYVHPHDPFVRVDVLISSRHVKVVVNGVPVAETTRPSLLFETGLPTRYYIPKTDVRMDLMEPSDSTSRCPYKGQASYYHVNAGGKRFEDLAWFYREPIPECPKIENLVSFYNEKVDVYVDGQLQERPESPWSK